MMRLVTLILLMALYASNALAAFDIPTIYITTADSIAITSKDYWLENTTLEIVMPDGSVSYKSTKASVRARGNSTFNKPKKPFAIKLIEESGLLGMQESKRWILLANFMDHSLLRNSLALRIAKQTCLDWTPESRLVDVIVNGKLQGCYLLCEQIRVDKNKVNIDKDDGFLIEMDNYPNEEYRFETEIRHLPVNVKYPQKPSETQMSEIEKYFDYIEQLIYKGTPDDFTILYNDYIDMDSFVDWWIVHELAQNAEPNGPRSCYMHKDKNGLLKAGPVWDFDLAFITVGLDQNGDIRPSRLNRTDVILLNGDSIYNGNALWYDQLLKEPQFRNRVKNRWKELEPRFKDLENDIDKWEKLISASALADEQLWKGKDPARFDTFTTFKSSVSNLKNVYMYRINSLGKLIANM
ncbi:MAG: CotH kinase family protein [Prevotellaceae bacterium]|nr:CotH kinase family protein [Prevotellaceae bacterium]